MTQINFSVKALIIKDDCFLALHKCNATSDTFDLPGGKMKANESAEETPRGQRGNTIKYQIFKTTRYLAIR